MKKFLRSIFFWDEPSQGAFSALTLLLLLAWGYLTAFCTCLVCHYRLPWLDSAAVLCLLLSFVILPVLYILFLLLKEVVHWAKKTPYFWKKLTLTLLVVTTLTVVATICEQAYLPISSIGEVPETNTKLDVWNALAFSILGFCFLFRPLVSPTKLLASMIAWIGSFLVFSTLLLLADPLIEKLPSDLHPIHWLGKNFPYVLPFCRWFHLNGDGCLWFALTGFLLAGIAYLLAGNILAHVSATSLRRLFQRSIRIQWYIMAGIYAVSLGFALVNTNQYRKAVLKLEVHFDRPMTTAELGKLYYGGMAADAVFWEKVAASVERYSNEYRKVEENNEYDFDEAHLNAVLPPELYEKRKNGFLASVAAAQFDNLLAAPLPPNQRHYGGESPFQMRMQELSHCRLLAKMEQRRCLYAMETVDFAMISQAFVHIDRLLEYLGREPSPIGFCIWLSIGRTRNDMLARLLEANLVSKQWLQEQSKELLHDEEEAGRREKGIIYASTVECLDLFHRLVESDFGVTGISDYDYALKYSPIRFLFPQGWWLAVKSAKDYAMAMKVSSFDQGPQKVTGSILVDMFAASLSYYEKGVQRYIASSRIMRGLLLAELHNRQAGNYPDFLPELPLDPFSNQPMKYRKGECKVIRYYCQWKPSAWEQNDPLEGHENEGDVSGQKGCWEFVTQEEIVNAVQIWSVGPNGVDDGGLYKKAEYGSEEKDKDDIRSIIPLREGVTGRIN